MRRKTRRKSIPHQVRKMKETFSQFHYEKRGKVAVWLGQLTPRRTPYTVRVWYEIPYSPEVHVLDPQIRNDAPHLYHSKYNALCLHYPKDYDWTSEKYISDTIVPWTSEWLWFYENWCITGKWFGDEAPHSSK